MHRIDYTVLPVISMFYLLSVLCVLPALDPILGLNGRYIFQDRINVFLPHIFDELGFSQYDAQCWAIPCGFFRCVLLIRWTLRQITALPLLFNLVLLISSYLSDRYQSRRIAIVLTTLLVVAGQSIYLGK